MARPPSGQLPGKHNSSHVLSPLHTGGRGSGATSPKTAGAVDRPRHHEDQRQRAHLEGSWALLLARLASAHVFSSLRFVALLPLLKPNRSLLGQSVPSEGLRHVQGTRAPLLTKVEPSRHNNSNTSSRARHTVTWANTPPNDTREVGRTIDSGSVSSPLMWALSPLSCGRNYGST